jgi:hypothetical protein
MEGVLMKGYHGRGWRRGGGLGGSDVGGSSSRMPSAVPALSVGGTVSRCRPPTQSMLLAAGSLLQCFLMATTFLINCPT